VKPEAPKFSIVIPARNEERFLGKCLESIRIAAKPYEGRVEIIVVLNRCSDNTEEIAKSFGARLVREDAKNLAKVRNAGARHAAGEMLVTIDADSTMTSNTLLAIDRALSSGRTVGGGTWIRPERLSAGIIATLLLLAPFILYYRVTGGLFWCYRKDFEAVGGFDESLITLEDLDFARRLKVYGKRVGRPFSTLRRAHIVTSCRKFDKLGDWYLVRNPIFTWRILWGNNQRAADAFFYEIDR